MKYLTTLLALLFATAAVAAPPLGNLTIPGSRVPGWTRVDNTLPDTSGWTVTPFNAVNCANGTTAGGTQDQDNFAALNTAITSAATNTVIQLQSNCTYDFGGQILIADKKGLVIRGGGMDSTIVELADTVDVTFFQVQGGAPTIPGVTWTAGFTAGTCTFTAADVTTFAIGDYVSLRSDYPTATWDQVGARIGAQTHVSKITAVVDAAPPGPGGVDTITVDVCLPIDFRVGNANIAEIGPGADTDVTGKRLNIGIENLQLKKEGEVPGGDPNPMSYRPMIGYAQTFESWVTGVKFQNIHAHSLFASNSARVLVRGNTFTDQLRNIPFNKGHIRLSNDSVTGWQIENNAFLDCDVCVELENGANLNIIAYNYMQNDNGTCERPIFFHNDFSNANLVEGNDIECRLEWDSANGGTGPYNTIYRNRVRNTQSILNSPGQGGNIEKFNDGDVEPPPINDHWQINLLANHFSRLTGVGGFDKYGIAFWIEKNVMRFQCQLDQNGASPVGICSGATAPFIADTTWADNVIANVPPSSWSTFSFPDSLYYTTPPAWWCRESGTFPNIGAPSDRVGDYSKLPAQIRVDNLACTTTTAHYYACDCEAGAEGGCVAGNNASAGTSPATAWETYDKLQDQVANSACGDTFNFCMGGSFRQGGSNEWLGPGDCSANPRIIQSYQPGSFVNPPVYEVTGAGLGSFQFNASGNRQGILIRDLYLYCSNVDGCSTSGVQPRANYVTIDNVRMNGFDFGSDVGAVNIQHFHITNSTLENIRNFGLLGQTGTDTVVDGNTFRNNGCLDTNADGQCSTAGRALYFNCDIATGCDPTRVVTVTDNQFIDNTLDAWSGTQASFGNIARCRGNPVSLRGGTISFERNSFSYTDPTGNGCYNVRMAVTTADSSQRCTNCTFRQNRIVGGTIGLNFFGWDGGVIENNIIVLPDVTHGFATSSPNMGIAHWDLGSGLSGTSTGNPTVRNNTLVVGTATYNGSSSFDAAFYAQAAAGNWRFYNNAIRMTGAGAANICYRFADATAVSTNYFGNNNICHRQGAGVAWANWGTGDQTLATFVDQTDPGVGGTEDTASIDGDPGFVGTGPTYDITLQRGDQAIDSGTATTTAALDYYGAARPGGVSPDVGAFEWYPGWFACDCEPGAEEGCVAGSDSNPGTREAPYESYDKLQDQVAGMACGDTFNFCRGGKWTAAAGSADWSKAALSCAADPILIQSYHPPSTNFVTKPKIQLATHATTFNFDDAGNNIWLQNLDLTCAGACTAGATGTVMAATGDAIKLDAMVFDGWTIGLQGSAGTILNVINSTFRNNDVRAILATPGTGSVFNNNTFTNNSCLTGGTCSAEQAVLLTCTTVGECTRNVAVTNNTFTDNTMDPTAAPVGACNGNTLSLRGGTFTVEGNQFSLTDPSLTTGACENVRIGSITPGEPEQECVDCLFRRNRIVGGNVGLAIQSWKDGGDSDSWGGIIENNIIILPENTSSTTFAANISGRESDNAGIDNANVLIRNNSMIIGDNASVPAGADSAVFDLRDNTGTYVVRNNTSRIDGLGENVCFKYGSSANLADRIDTDYNLCDRLADPGTNGWGALGGAPTTLAAFHAVDGDTDDDQSWDAQSGFAGLSPEWDMHLIPDVIQLIGFPFEGQLVTLEMDGGGDPNNFAPTDIDGVVRPLGPPFPGLPGPVPDIGAYEAPVPPTPLGR